MGVIIKSKSAKIETKWGGLSFAVPEGIVAFHLLTGGTEDARKNWADPEAPLSAVGSPVQNADGLSLSSADYLELGVETPLNATVLVLCRGDDTNASSATRPTFVGAWLNTGSPSLMLYAFDATHTKTIGEYAVNGTTVQVTSDAVLDTINDWGVRGFTIDNAGPVSRNLTTNLNATVTPPAGAVRQEASGRKLRIGSNPSATSYKGKSRAAIFAMWNRVLSPAELAEAKAQISAMGETVGITS